MNNIATELNPKQTLDNKNNFKRFILIERNGETNTRIILSVPDMRLREQIICNHFLSRHVQIFIKEMVGVKTISRDSPWDFELELSNNEKLKIEITSIADHEDLFKKLKYEERLVESTRHKQIELQELIKLNFNFPSPDIYKQIHDYENKGLGCNDVVPNPYFEQQFIFQSNFNPIAQSFERILTDSIERKVKKKHIDKGDVCLIIDNRTVRFNLKDMIQSVESMENYFSQLPFKEVWIYTGYYSDNDGNNAEYSFMPIKITSEKRAVFEKELLK